MTDPQFEEPELEDVVDEGGMNWSRFDQNRLSDPIVLRALVGIVVALLLLLWPERSDRDLSQLIGSGLLLYSATSIWARFRIRPRRWLHLATAAAAVAVGLFLVFSPNQSETFIGRLVAALFVTIAVRDLVGDLRSTVNTGRLWAVTRTAALLGVAALLLSFPSEILSAAATVAAIGWIAVSAMVLVVSFDENRSGASSYSESGQIVLEWLTDRPKSVDDREALYAKILFDGPNTQQRIIRFFALMGFASVIASMGVITDSTAVVIGAMLIAPLMTPLMGMAMSLAMGWPKRLARSALVAFGGIGFAIGIGVLLGLLVPAVIDPTTNAQIISRSSPTTLDLIIAIAAGAAGAYGLSRPDVSDSLPGVAIAISLVPPLTVVGIAYSQGAWSAGSGALLLFSTNMLAILIMGGITFIATGVTPIQRLTSNQHRVRTSLAAVAAISAIVMGFLLLNGSQLTANLLEQATVESTVEDWMSESPDHGVARIARDDDIVVVTIVGPSEGAPTAADLAKLLEERLDQAITADVRLIVEERDIATSGG